MNNRILKALIGLSALLLSFALSGSVNLPAVDVVVVADDCFTSTYDIIQAQLTDPRDEYIVCPDTYIKVGAPTIDLDSFGGGDWPLMALGSDVKILCGQTGSRNNNCTLESSFFHFMAVPDFPALGVIGVWADNLYVSGFTFTGSKVFAVLHVLLDLLFYLEGMPFLNTCIPAILHILRFFSCQRSQWTPAHFSFVSCTRNQSNLQRYCLERCQHWYRSECG